MTKLVMAATQWYSCMHHMMVDDEDGSGQSFQPKEVGNQRLVKGLLKAKTVLSDNLTDE